MTLANLDLDNKPDFKALHGLNRTHQVVEPFLPSSRLKQHLLANARANDIITEIEALLEYTPVLT